MVVWTQLLWNLLWLLVWTDNFDPKLVARWYFNYLYEWRVIASMIRIDKGTETGEMATLHVFLQRNHGDVNPKDTVVYGKSTSDQEIINNQSIC